MNSIVRSTGVAIIIAGAIQCLTLGLAPKLPRSVCSPDVREVHTQTLPAVRQFRVRNTDGAVRIETHDAADHIKMTATIRGYAAGAAGREALAAYVETLFAIDAGEEELVIVTEPEDRPDAIELTVDYTIAVPAGTDIDINVSNGNVWVGKGCGRVTVRGNNTGIEIAEPGGSVIARSIIGRIQVHGAGGATTLETVNGNIHASLRGGAIRATTTNGNIMTSLLTPEVTWCDLTTKNGRITLDLSEECTAFVNAHTQRGVITSAVDISPVGGMHKRRELYGVIGNGRTKVNMSALNGNIAITRSERT